MLTYDGQNLKQRNIFISAYKSQKTKNSHWTEVNVLSCSYLSSETKILGLHQVTGTGMKLIARNYGSKSSQLWYFKNIQQSK